MSSISCIPEPRPRHAAGATFLFFRETGNATNRRLAVRHALQDIGAPVELVNQNGDDVTGSISGGGNIPWITGGGGDGGIFAPIDDGGGDWGSIFGGP